MENSLSKGLIILVTAIAALHCAAADRPLLYRLNCLVTLPLSL
jgi:hypothetical protein